MLTASMVLDLLTGVATTVAISTIAIAAGVPLGLLLALGRSARMSMLRTACAIYASRGTRW